MSFSIQTNVSSLIAQENLRVNNEFQSRTITRLTSGYRINASGDDAAGLAVANKFRSEVTELTQGVRNANDGISTLQIIDGGLSNISKMLDRMKTLATQSASSTFRGNRATLNTEFSQLLTEIDRQAANVGLNTDGAYNKNISVYIGGAGDGSAASNAKVNIDLNGAANAVDQAGLSLSGASVAGAAIELGDAAAGYVTTAVSFNITTVNSNGASYYKSFTSASGAGMTAADVVSELNKQVAADAGTANTGITFAIKDGKLMVGGTSAFNITTSGAGAATDVMTSADVTNVANKAMHWKRWDGLAAQGGDAVVKFTSSSGESRSVTLLDGTSVQDQVTAINAAAKDLGIYALWAGEAGTISVQSSNSFTVAKTSAGATTAGFGHMAAPAASANADAALSATAAAESALARLANAVTSLGNVQGRVGAGQNKLQYAIQLAQSQISNYSAAESRIRDADVAAEAANLTKAQVLQQASLAAMAQANSAPQAVMALLRG